MTGAPPSLFRSGVPPDVLFPPTDSSGRRAIMAGAHLPEAPISTVLGLSGQQRKGLS